MLVNGIAMGRLQDLGPSTGKVSRAAFHSAFDHQERYEVHILKAFEDFRNPYEDACLASSGQTNYRQIQ